MSYGAKVSFIIVNYNGKEHLNDCFKTLEKLDYPKESLEFIMVDNGSIDGSVQFVEKKFPFVIILKNQQNEGFAKPNNDAAKIASGEFIVLLNNDMRIEKNWLKNMFATLENAKKEEDKYVCVGSKILNWDGTQLDFAGGSISFYGHGYQYDYGMDREKANKIYSKDRDILFACGGAMLIERKVFLEVGGFDEDYFAYFEDVDLGWRLWILGYKVKFCADAICYHKHNSTSKKLDKTKLQTMYNRNSLYTIYKNYGDDMVYNSLISAILLKVYKGNKGLLRENFKESSIDEETKAQFLALEGFTKGLKSMKKKRQYVQKNRRVSDKTIIDLFIEAPYKNLIMPVKDSFYNEVFKNLIDGMDIEKIFGSLKYDVLLISSDNIGVKMAGPGIRYWEMAKQLSEKCNITLAIPNETDIDSSLHDINLVNYSIEDHSKLVTSIIENDVIIIQGMILELIPNIKEIIKDKVIVVDLYDPYIIENLEVHKQKNNLLRKDIHENDLNSLVNQIKIGDYFICANQRQKDFWVGMLSSFNKINPAEYDLSSNLENLIGIVPFGIPTEEAKHTRSALIEKIPNLKSTDRVLIWGGGIWNWFDPLTLIKAVHKLSQTRQNIKLFFLGVKHPNPAIPEMEMTNEAINLAEKLAIKDTYVFFNMDWVEYQDRQNFLLESYLGVSCHFNNLETRYSFRTRALDYLWADLPMVVTEGDYFAEEVIKHQLGLVVSYQDPDDLADAILKLVEDEKLHNSCKENIKQYKEKYRWNQIIEPLRHFCSNPIKKKIGMSYEDYNYITDIKQESKNTVVGELLEGEKIGQKFRCRYPNLASVDIMIATYARINNHKIKFYLYEYNTNLKVAEKEIEASILNDNSWINISFDPIINSEGREFYFYLETIGSGFENAITIWQNSDTNRFGNIWRNGNLTQGNLAFKTNCVFSENPLDPAKGKVLPALEEAASTLLPLDINLDSVDDIERAVNDLKNRKNTLREHNNKKIEEMESSISDIIVNINNINNWILNLDRKLKKIKGLFFFNKLKKVFKRK